MCLNCGVQRKRRTRTLLMAITNFPPYNHYKYDYLWFYWTDDINKGTFIRPNCTPPLNPGVAIADHGIKEESLPF
jgi:hypothetical protein